MFKRFGTIVTQHQELVERIDTKTADALDDLEGAKNELIDTHNNVSDTRKLMLKIFLILMIFVTFWIVFVL
jgi:syntaxin 5